MPLSKEEQDKFNEFLKRYNDPNNRLNQLSNIQVDPSVLEQPKVEEKSWYDKALSWINSSNSSPSPYIPSGAYNAISELDVPRELPIVKPPPMPMPPNQPSTNFQPVTNIDPYINQPTPEIDKPQEIIAKKATPMKVQQVSPKPMVESQSPQPVETVPSLNDLSAMLNQKEEGSREDLLAAQEDARQARMGAAILRSGQEIGAAIAGVKPNTDFADMMYKEADRSLLERQQLIENQKNDPQSRESLLAKQVYKKFTGEEAPANFTAKAFEKFVGPLQHFQTSKENREARIEENKQRALDRKVIESTKLEEKNKVKSEKDQKYKDDMTNKMSEQVTKGRLGKALEAYDNSKGLMREVEEIVNQKDSDPQVIENIILKLGSMKTLQRDNSVVRESDLKAFEQSLSYLDEAKAVLSRFSGQKRLPPEVKKQILRSIKMVNETNERAYRRAAYPKYKQAKDMGLDSTKIFPADFLNEGGELSPEPTKTEVSKIQIREKSTGRVKLIDSNKAQEILKDSRYEQVK